MSFATLISAYPKLKPQEVAIWIVETNDLLEYCYKLESVLSNEEIYRSRAFYFKADSERYICSHGMLRLILGHYTNTNPVSLTFTSNSYGKPRLADQEYIKFNLSHTKDLIALAVTINREVGIDIEKCTFLSNIDDMARNIMHKDELLEYYSVPAYKRNEYFYRCWVKKESIVKALGTGLYEDIHQIKLINYVFPYIPQKTFVNEDLRKKEWCIKELNPIAKHFGAVCFEGNSASIRIIDKTTINYIYPF